MIERVRIEGEEDGWHLIVEGDWIECAAPQDEDRLDLRLSQEAAWALVDAVRPIAEWRAEGEAQRANVAAGRLSCGHDGWTLGCEICEREALLAGELLDDAESMRVGADLRRKREKEER